jgi:hypothetical protein
MEIYKETISVKKNIEKLKKSLDNESIDEDKQKRIINNFISQLIPPGTKGVIRGNMFNKIVKEHILSLNLDKERFDIKFEKKSEIFVTSEIPDWYIYDKEQNKIIIGMNQLDLWNGGQQLNRGSKYIINYNNRTNCKLLCVVCNNIIIKNNNNKIFKLFDIGLKNNTLCYINGLSNIINNYFIKIDI